MSSQVPQGFSYQAIARDASGIPISGATLKVKLGILSDTTTPVIIWEELHDPVETNAFGLFSIVLGEGTQSGGTAASFSAINWKITPLYISTLIFYQGIWRNMGFAKLWTVPYAMVAGDLSGPVKKLTVAGETSDMEEVLFEVKNKNGQTVFAVYNEGVRIYVADGAAKGTTKGGFAIGGFGTDKGVSQKYFMVKPDSIRMYIDDTPGKGNTKGGFAIGGFGSAKGLPNNYLSVSSDSTNIFVHKLTPVSSSTFNILAINQNNVRKAMMNANTDTINIGGVMNVQNNLVVGGNIDIGGTINTVSDIDGNTYKTVTVGTQVWMKENLKTTKFSDGTAIPLVTDNPTWAGLTTAAYCWINNDAATYKATYGAIYNWFTVDAVSNGGKNVCPAGWHVPTDPDWTILTTYLGGESVAGGKLKETGIIHWAAPNTDATNETGFTALPGGYRIYLTGVFSGIGNYGEWWSSTEYTLPDNGFHRPMDNNSGYSGQDTSNKLAGLSVRCLKD